MNTVTDTLTVDLTNSSKENDASIKSFTNKNNYIKKKVGWHTKKRGIKHIIIGKKDDFEVEVGEEVYILTESAFENLKRPRQKEEKSWIKRKLHP